MAKSEKSSRKKKQLESSPSFKSHPTHAELYAIGKERREKCPREAHATWIAPHHRADPVALMHQANVGRIPHLVPIRHGRMLQSPFTFYRGAALNMAADLAKTPTSGAIVQACGDCHLLNFGSFATPERRIIFDINDLDETLPAPWEWDVKRLAASFILACRDNGFSNDTAEDTVLRCVQSYREHMHAYSEMTVMEIWYASMDAEKLISDIEDEEARKRFQKRMAKARERSVLEHQFPEIATNAGFAPVIRESPPLIYHSHSENHDELWENVEKAFANYRKTLQEDRRLLLDRYKVMDYAMKVVGVGSVGTYCGVILLMASEHDPLFLQVKQARPSVLEAYVAKSRHKNDGERVVHGCRMMQSASDLFLGWTEGNQGRQFYVRQLKDMKIKPMTELFTPSVMLEYADLCGWTLAHAHARSGEPTQISGYLGKSDVFDKAIAKFAIDYSDQTEQDHEVLMNAARDGHLEVFVERDESA